MEMKLLVSVAFAASIGMSFVILACALPEEKNWWPMMVIFFYLLAPIPTFVSKRNNVDPYHTCMDFAVFLTMGIVVSSFALPIVLSRSPRENPVIPMTACYYTLIGNIIIYTTYAGYFLYALSDERNLW